jgi:hypothetical protein
MLEILDEKPLDVKTSWCQYLDVERFELKREGTTMYDPYTLDRIRFEQEARQRRVARAPQRSSRARNAGRRLNLAGALHFRRTTQPCID